MKTKETITEAITLIDEQGKMIKRLRSDVEVLQGQFDRAVSVIDKALGLLEKEKGKNAKLRGQIANLVQIVDDLDYRPDE